jgi:hypothetical protein
LRLSYTGKFGFGWAKPSIDIDAIQIYTKGYTETGVGLANMKFPDAVNTSFRLTPMLELGARGELTPAFPVTGYLRGGAIISGQNVWTIQTEFAEAPPGSGVINLRESFDNVVGKVEAGVQAGDAFGTNFHLDYRTLFSNTTLEQQVAAGLTVRF